MNKHVLYKSTSEKDMEDRLNELESSRTLLSYHVFRQDGLWHAHVVHLIKEEGDNK